MKKHLMPAFRYTLKDYCRSAGVFVGVIVLVMVFFTVQVSVNGNGNNMALSGLATASCIFRLYWVLRTAEKLRLIISRLSRSTSYQAGCWRWRYCSCGGCRA